MGLKTDLRSGLPTQNSIGKMKTKSSNYFTLIIRRESFNSAKHSRGIKKSSFSTFDLRI